jgi:hypothetical protein
MIDRDMAQAIRSWALTVMTEAELHAHSQRQILHRYITEHLRPTLAKVAPQLNDPKVQERAQAAAERLIREHPADTLSAADLINAMKRFACE